MSKYNHLEVEQLYQHKWIKEQIYAYQPASKNKTFVIDTPPPTVSGDLHIGHIFSYTQTDILARFHRMQGKNVFYPMGWDDNGLPTEKRSQNLYGVKCDPTLDYNSSLKFEKLKKPPSSYQVVSRKNFLEICEKQVLEDESKYKALWNHIALSVDWNQNYRSIDLYAQSLAQISFLDLCNKGLTQNRLSPVLWDTQFQTAVAQADVEDRSQKGFFHFITFKVKESKSFTIATTRPELLPACVAVVAHPKDDRYKSFFGGKATVPLFDREVPIIPSEHADPEKGTGILMVCTFGDMEDVSFCKKHQLPILQIIDDSGFMMDIDFNKEPFQSLTPVKAQSHYSHLKGLRIQPARKKIVEILKDKGELKQEPKECEQSVKFYEKGDFPLEILPKRQWYIKILDHKEELLQQGKKIQWHPPSMRKRYDQWVEGLNQDWCISRQRVYGVPFPVWYKINDKKQTDYNQVLTPDLNAWLNKKHIPADPFNLSADGLLAKLTTPPQNNYPIDPLKSVPKGFKEEQRFQAGGFKAELDVMDTWAVSSLSPYINSGWVLNPEKHKKLFPADLRPQAHEIIRTWAFYTIAKSYFHEKQIPWTNIAVSGWVVTPKRTKMSKSKGNALAPEALIQTYSADAVRYWTAKARLGQDTVYDENLFKTGKRLTVKIFNASRFVQMQLQNLDFIELNKGIKEISVPVDQAWLQQLIQLKLQVIVELNQYNYAGALEIIEKSFWSFCDNYLELVKARVYQLKDQPQGVSGLRTLDYSLYLFLKLLAPYLPYVTEAVWQNRYSEKGHSLHSTFWMDKKSLEQTVGLLTHCFNGRSVLENAFLILDQMRSAKSDLNKSLASPVKTMQITAQSDHLKEFELYKEDIARASHADLNSLVLIKQDSLEKPAVKIQIAD